MREKEGRKEGRRKGKRKERGGNQRTRRKEGTGDDKKGTGDKVDTMKGFTEIVDSVAKATEMTKKK